MSHGMFMIVWAWMEKRFSSFRYGPPSFELARKRNLGNLWTLLKKSKLIIPYLQF